MHLFSLLLVAFFSACGSDSKRTTDAAVPDGPPPVIVDAAADAMPAPPMITISGTAVERMVQGSAPVEGATITGYRNGDDTTPVATTTSAADGTYTLTIATGGVALDGYLKATKTGFKDTYLYPPAPIAANVTAPINMVTPTIYNALVILGIGAGQQQAINGLIALIVVSGATADSMPVVDAKVSSNPESTYRYNGANGLPDATAEKTAADGTAYMFNVPADRNVVVSASKTGATFTSHGLKAWPDQLTTTLITP